MEATRETGSPVPLGAPGTEPATGLSPAEAAARLARDGPNELPPPRRERWPARLLRHLGEPMSLLLIGAAAVDGIGLGERLDAAAILAIVALNAAIALAQEGKAARDLDALRTMETPMARVVRGSVARAVPSRELVAGDIVLLAAGDRVPADLRLLETSSLEVDESVLTGESLPVAKDARAVPDERASLADRTWMTYTGTLVSRGAARGLVVATGTGTELGKVAARLRGGETSTPLADDLARLTARLGAVAVVIAGGVFILTFTRMGLSADALQRAFLPAVALAVAAVPEGLATVVTVGLALGVRRMAEHGAIVRRLLAVETLGQATVILTDKTGTLTENRMRVEAVVLPGRGAVSPAELDPDERRRVAEVALLCNDATLEPQSGDPLEVALLEAFREDAPAVERDSGPRLATAPFDAERKLMSTVYATARGAVLLVKGAPESVAGRSTLSGSQRDALLAGVEALAGRGMRTLALARRGLALPPEQLDEEERDLDLVAVVALRDPVRPEATRAVADSRSAGVLPIMVTGDHAATAAAVAAEVGLADGPPRVVTGAQLRKSGIPSDPDGVDVYARIDPDEKLALVEAFREAGHVVAVTGDGVNDAPALRRAHIGVAMGRAGSDVAREAADMVVTDDNLATIVRAIREGRGIYDNIRKVVDYLVAGNLSEIAVVVACLILFPDLAVPLLPLQLLWVNLLTDGLPAVALGLDPASPDLARGAPRRRGAQLLTAGRIGFLLSRGLLIASAAVASLVVARFVWQEPWPHARGVMFTVLVVAHLLYAFVVRNPTARGALASLASNPWLLAAVGAGIALQLVAVAWPPARAVFGTAPLSLREWALVVSGGVMPVVAMLALLPDPAARDDEGRR